MPAAMRFAACLYACLSRSYSWDGRQVITTPLMRFAALPYQCAVAFPAPLGTRISSTRCWMCSGGFAVILETRIATPKLTTAPTAPKAYGARRQAESDGHGTGREVRWVQAEVSGQGDGTGHGDTPRQ